MGMFNEVWKTCPKCRSERGYAQISQIVLGFGGFYLDRPERLVEDLTLDQLLDLETEVTSESCWFNCQSCDHRFRLLDEVEIDERRAVAERLARPVRGGE